LKTLNYITYQTFPASTANSLQTISHLNHFSKKGWGVKLFFPLREKNSTDNMDELSSLYQIDRNVEVKGIDHPYPFGRIKLLEKFMYSISHYLWSRNFIKNGLNLSSQEYYMTRSDWIAYYLAKSGNNVIFEIHNYSKTRNYVLRKISKFENIKLIFLTEGLKKSFSDLPSRYEVIPSGVDESLFQELGIKNLDTVFVGNLKRFGQSRNIDFLIKAFSENNELQNIKLTVVGGPSEEIIRLKKLLKKDSKNIDFVGSLNREETISHVQRAKVGILINSSSNIHSLKYTSPLKYFEYLYADLNIVAVDFESHHELPGSENIYFYKENDTLDFSKKIISALENKPKPIDKTKIEMSTRVEQIIHLFNT
jgi:hypothetical protein